MINIEVSYLMSPRLARLGYLFYDWQALFNLDATSRLGGREGERNTSVPTSPCCCL